MRIATRTALAAAAAAIVAIVVVTVVATILFRISLRDRVDEQLVDRAERAPVLVAVGERVSISELNDTIDGARVRIDGRTIDIGRLPDDPLPPIESPGWRIADADGEQWRLYAVRVENVPLAGDTAIVEFAEPLGDVDARAQALRRRTLAIAAFAALAVAGLGWWWGRRAARPLTDLAADANRIGVGPPDAWAVRADTGTPEVDAVARALNENLDRLARQTERTEEALGSARSFASAASHELRTPLQSAMTNLDLVLTDETTRHEVRAARTELARMGAALSAVRALSEVELLGPDDFTDTDLAEVADQAVAALAGRFGAVDIAGPDVLHARLWSDGVRLAVENVVRNAAVHAITNDRPAHIAVTLSSPATVTVDDNGPGVAVEDRERVLRRFERGTTDRDGSGLGLAFADRVAVAHGGGVTLEDSPLGGLRVVLRFAPATQH